MKREEMQEQTAVLQRLAEVGRQVGESRFFPQKTIVTAKARELAGLCSPWFTRDSAACAFVNAGEP